MTRSTSDPTTSSRDATAAASRYRGPPTARRSASEPPQPSWYRRYAVDQQTGQPESHLELYRTALALRRKLRTDDDVVWVEHPDRPGVLHLRRSNGWNCLTNFTCEQIPMPAGQAVLRSMPSDEPELVEPETTIWFETDA